MNIISFLNYNYVFYFVDPGCTFFANLIFFHDEVCFFLVWILVFTYWMMYSILTDHIYIIKSSIFIPLTSKIQTLSPIRFYLFFLLKFHFFLNLFSINLYNYYYDNVFFTFINNIISYIYNFLLFLLGNQTNTYYDNMDSPSFFNDDSLQSSLFNTYDDSSKVLFSDNNSNIFSLQGKLLNIEELFLLTKLSSDLNLLKFNRIYPLYTKFIEKQSTNSFIILLNKYYSNIENNNNSLSLGKLIKFFILILIYIDKFLSIFRLPKVKPEISNNFYSNNYSNSNFIFNINFNIQDLFFYNRRLDNIYYSLNPFLTIFNDIFSLNDNTNSLYSHKEPGNYKWWEFKYIYTITKSKQYFTNLSNLSRGINRDIVMASWEYHHSISFEYIWALFPTSVILSIIGPSFILLYSSLSFNDAFLSVKVIGHQWYWSYELSSVDSTDSLTKDSIIFDSRILDFPSFKTSTDFNTTNPLYGFNRLLAVDNHLLLVAHKPVNFLITSGDVLHSFAVPAFGIKVDAVPGRINTFYLEGSRIGTFYGQCSELCGFGHGFMPIAIEVIQDNIIN